MPSGGAWQQKIIRADRDGPGIVGYYLDTVALLASLCPLVPEVEDDTGKWVRSEDPVLHKLVSGYRSPLFAQHELVSMHVRHLEALGESWIIFSRDIGFCVVTVPNVTTYGARGQVQWTDPYGLVRRSPEDVVWRSWTPDPYEPHLPNSPLRRAIPDIRRLNAAVRSQTRAAESRLLTNGIIAFSEGEGGPRPLIADTAADGTTPASTRQGADELIEDYLDLATKGFTDDDSVAAHAPFPMIGPKPEYVDVGRGIDEYAMKAEDKAIEAFARTVNFPAQLLVDGPGAANHWNEWILQEVQHKMGLAPKLNPVCDDVTTFYLRPQIRRLLEMRVGEWRVDPMRVRIRPDYTFLTSKPDKSGKVLEAYRLGAIGREEAMMELGFSTMLELPPGLSEFEFWELSTGGKGAPYVEVDADGRVVVAEDTTEETEQGMADAFGELPADGGEFEDLEMPAPVDGVVDETRDAPPTPEDPSGVVAAVSDPDDTAKVEALLAQLVAIDKSLEVGLTAAATAAVTVAVREVAKAVIRAYPRAHEDRKRLRDLPSEQVWAAADSAVTATVDVEPVVAEAVAPHQAQFEDYLATAAAATIAAHSGDDDDDSVVPELFVAAGVAALVAGLISTISGWFGAAGLSRTGDPTGFGGKVARVPSEVVREAMAATGGAAVGANGRVLLDPTGAPTPRTGGEWRGDMGVATGHNSVSMVDVPDGHTVGVRWFHSFFGAPADPFPPHEDLDGQVFPSLSAIPGGWRPADHKGCRCAALPTIIRL